MKKLKPYSSSKLASGGYLLAGMGIYFVFFSHSGNIPLLSMWLQKVFWIMGGYIFTTGLLTIFITRTSFRSRTHRACSIVAISGISSIAAMTLVNFMITSDFKWTLFAFIIPWLLH